MWPKWPVQFLYLRGLLVIVGGFMVELSLGSIYTYGNMKVYIYSYIRHQSHPADLRQELTIWVFASTIIGEGLASLFGGMLVGIMGPRWTTLTGCCLFSMGLGLSYFTLRVSFWLLLLTYGFMLGVGVGIGNIGPISAAMKWMPRWKGVASGIVLAGYGLSNFFFAFIQTKIINPHNVQAVMDDQGSIVFDDPDLLARVPESFIYITIIHVVIQIIGALLITNPPEGYTTELNRDTKVEEYYEVDDTTEIVKIRSMWGLLKSKMKSFIKRESNQSHDFNSEPEKPSNDDEESMSSVLVREDELPEDFEEIKLTADEKEDNDQDTKASSTETNMNWSDDDIISLTPLQMLRRPYFYVLYAMFGVNVTAIIFIASFYKSFGLLFIPNDHFLTIVSSLSSIFNTIGRIFWGFIADRISHKLALVLLSSILTIFLLTFYATALVSIKSEVMFTIWISVIFLCIGGNFAVFPAATGHVFGLEHVAVNYGILGTCKIFAGPLAAILSTVFVTHYFYLLLLVSALSGIGFVLSIVYKPKLYIRTIKK